MFDCLPAELQARIFDLAVPPRGSTWADQRIRAAVTIALVHPTWTAPARRLIWEPLLLSVFGDGARDVSKLEDRIKKAEEALGRPVRSLWLELPMHPEPKETRGLELVVGKCPHVEEAWISEGGKSFETLCKLSKLTRLHLVGTELERGASFAGIADRLTVLSIHACNGALYLAPFPHLCTLVLRACQAPEQEQDVNLARQFPSLRSFDWESIVALPTPCVNTLPASVRRLALAVTHDLDSRHDTGVALVLPKSLTELVLRGHKRKGDEDDEAYANNVRKWGQQACSENGARLEVQVDEVDPEGACYEPPHDEVYDEIGYGLWY